ncbi:unnamed protein product [Oikopleura dioica]|uniref:Uncharacterized protein n=2 Tax=Oikopleura dioica TaxID=34765 RepID=E4Z0H1_OIKDI|nr:unnamed protein product [Oikopleura dioica]
MITRHLSRRITPLIRRNSSSPLKNVSQESSGGKILLVGATFLKAVTPLIFGFGFIYAYRILFLNDSSAIPIEQANLQGKVVVITGSSSGFGKFSAKGAAERGATVVLASRSQKNLEVAKKFILKEVPDANVDLVHLNLADLDSVEKCAVKLLKKYGKVDVLVNNAAIFKPNSSRDPDETSDGFDTTFHVGFLGHFLLGELLKDSLKENNGRMVSVVCPMMKEAQISLTEDKSSTFKDLKTHASRIIDPTNYNQEDAQEKFKHIESYMQTKLCLYMAAKRWSRDVNSISVDPGTSNETLLNRYTKQDVNFKGTILRAYNMIRWSVVLPSVENASQTIISAISDSKYNADEFNGKVLCQHSTKEYDDYIEKSAKPKSRDRYFAQITADAPLDYLYKISSNWTSLEERKKRLDKSLVSEKS